MNNKKIKKATVSKAIDYQVVFNTEEGKRVLYDMMKNTGALTSSFNPDNPHITSFNEGQRSVCISIMKHLKFNPQKFEKMMQQGEQEYDYGIDE